MRYREYVLYMVPGTELDRVGGGRWEFLNFDSSDSGLSSRDSGWVWVWVDWEWEWELELDSWIGRLPLPRPAVNFIGIIGIIGRTKSR